MAISMLDNIGYEGMKPDNARSSFATIDEMVNYSENYLPNIYITMVEETGKQYMYQRSNTVDENLGKWRLVEGGGSADLENYYNKTEIDTAFENAQTDWEKYTDDEIAKLNTDKAIACDEKPTIADDGTITYTVDGEDKTTTDEAIWFYYTEDDVLKQTRFIGGVEKTITSGGGADFDAYVKKVDGASGVSFEDDAHPLWTDVNKAIKGIIAKVEYVKPEIKTFTSDAQSVYEIGQKVSNIIFNWTLNKEITSQTLTDCTIDVDDRTATYDTELSTNKTFTLNVSDGENSASKQISIAFRNKAYFGGASEPTDYDSSFILGLAKNQFATSKAGSYAVTVGAGEYGYLAYPSSFGKITSVNIGGFDTDVYNCGEISFTNASGGVATYSIYRTGKQGLGSITMVVK